MKVLEFQFKWIQKLLCSRNNNFKFPTFYEFWVIPTFSGKFSTSTIFRNQWRTQQRLWMSKNIVYVDLGKIKTQNEMYFLLKKQFRMITSLVSAVKNTATLIWTCSKSICEFISGRTVCQRVMVSKFAKAYGYISSTD